MTQTAPQPFTLQGLRGQITPPKWSESVLLVIDAQNAYANGLLALPHLAESQQHVCDTLAKARAHNTPVIHIWHKGPSGSPFDPTSVGFAPLPGTEPLSGEAIVCKTMADGFAGTELASTLQETGRTSLIVIGYMTHNCVDSTVRSAVHQGYNACIIATACGTRDLPNPNGGTIPARALQDAVLSSLSDTIATIVLSVDKVTA